MQNGLHQKWEMSSDEEREKGISSLIIGDNHCQLVYMQTDQLINLPHHFLSLSFLFSKLCCYATSLKMENKYS